MKLKKIIRKVNNYFEKQSSGSAIKPKKLKKIRRLLLEKQQRYSENLSNLDDPDKRIKHELKLSVVNSQLNKIESLIVDIGAEESRSG